jgi:hypothetical protein
VDLLSVSHITSSEQQQQQQQDGEFAVALLFLYFNI